MDVLDDSDKLKELSKIQEPDPRVFFWQKSPQILLKNLHDDLNKIRLNDHVDLNVQKEFEKAKNIVLFSYYSYSMSSVAILHAYACLEKAITLKAKKLDIYTENIAKRNDKNLLFGRDGLKRKIIFSLEKKWIGRKHFCIFDSDEDSHDDESFSDRLDSWLGMRNSLAHNPSFLNILWNVPNHLSLFANMINAISLNNCKQNDVIPEIHLPKRSFPVDTLRLILLSQTHLLEFVKVKR